MKTILAVGCLFLVAVIVRGEVDQEVMDAIKDEMETCAEKVQITQEDIGVFINNKDLDDEMKAKSGCYNACLLTQLNMLENGVMKPENFQSVAEKLYSHKPEIIPQKVQAMTQCSEKVAGISDECELAYELITCLSN